MYIQSKFRMGIADFIKSVMPKLPNCINGSLLRCNHFHDLIYGNAMKQFKNGIPNINSEKKLIDIVNFSIKNVPYYRKKYGNLKISSIQEFKDKIGFIDKNEVMDNWADFVVDNIDMSKCIEGTTSGTSGRPLKFIMPKNRYITEMAFVTRIWQKIGWNFSRRANIRTISLPKGRDYMINPISKEILFDSFKMNGQYAKLMCRVMRKYRVDTLYTYPSAAYQFLKICEREGVDVSFIKYALLTSERVTPEQYEYIYNKLGIIVSSFYGHSEKLILAGSYGESKYILEPAYGFSELIDEEGKDVLAIGEIGELVGTTFYNRFMPLLRYKTGDFAEYGGDIIDTDGVRKNMLNSIIGRRDKSLIYRIDGTFTSDTALTLHGKFYEHIDGLQFIQTKKGYVEVLLIKNSQYTQEDENFIKQHMAHAMLGEKYVRIKYVGNLIFQPNGKFLPVINKCI